MDNFISSTQTLVKSFIIKDNDIAKSILYGLYKDNKITKEELTAQSDLLDESFTFRTDVGVDDFSTDEKLKYALLLENKYYLNLYGELHKTDTPVKITLIETNMEVELTKDLLETYKDTKKELLSCGEYYNNLISSNYEMIDYIHGCLYPVKPMEAFNSENGSIVNFNSNFLEKQEDYLIEEVNEISKNMIGKHIPYGYSSFNSFYIASYHTIIRLFLVNAVLGMRLSKMNTMNAHSYFLELKFKSTLDIWEEIKTLNEKSIWWLYANIDYYTSNLGSNDTYNKLLNDVLSSNSIGIGTYRCIRRDPAPVLNQYDIEESPFKVNEVIGNTKKLNSAYNVDDNTDYDLSSLNESLIELQSEYDAERITYEVEKSSKHIRENFLNTIDTKVMEISTLENFTSFNFDLFKVILDYWAYFLNNDLYGSFTNDKPTSTVEFQDPNTLMTYNVDSKSGFLIAMKMLLHASGVNTISQGVFRISTVINPDMSLKDVMENSIFKDGYTDKLLDTISQFLPSKLTETSSVTDVGNYLTDIIYFLKKYWLITSNVENQIVSANLYRIMNVMSLQEEAYFKKSITSVDIDKLLEENGIKFTISGEYNHLSALNELFKSVLGIEANSDIKLKDLLEGYKSLIRKMTSYTVEVLGKIKSEDKSYVNYQHVGPMLSNKGLLKLKPESVSGDLLEDAKFYLDFSIYNNNEDAIAYTHLPKARVKTEFNKSAEIYMNPSEVNILPKNVKIIIRDVL